MMSDAIPLIVVLLAFFIIMPLIVHLPIYIFRYFKMKKIAREKGPKYQPSTSLLTHNIWLILCLGGLMVVIPNYLKFAAKSPQAEAKENLGAIFTTQVAYFGEYNTYAGRKGVNGSGAFTDMGWSPEGDTRYAYYAGGDYIAPTKPKNTLKYKVGENWPYTIRPGVSATGFTVMAIGNIDNDPCLDVWMTNDSKELVNLYNDIAGVCPEKSAASKLWSVVVKSPVADILRMILGLFGLTSPVMIFLIPLMYYRAILQNRLYNEARAAMKAGPSREIGEKE
jgi:type IV pilus assembly protein PilA